MRRKSKDSLFINKKVSRCKWRKATVNGFGGGAGAPRVLGGCPTFEPPIPQLLGGFEKT